MERQRATSLPYMGLVDRRPVVCRNLAMGFWVPLHSFQFKTLGVVLFCAESQSEASTLFYWIQFGRRGREPLTSPLT